MFFQQVFVSTQLLVVNANDDKDDVEDHNDSNNSFAPSILTWSSWCSSIMIFSFWLGVEVTGASWVDAQLTASSWLDAQSTDDVIDHNDDEDENGIESSTRPSVSIRWSSDVSKMF